MAVMAEKRITRDLVRPVFGQVMGLFTSEVRAGFRSVREGRSS